MIDRATATRWGKRLVDDLLPVLDTLTPLLLTLLFVACVVAVMSFVPWQQNSDDLLPTLISRQRLTFYYWEQNRFANLLPLLVAWISDPTSNAYAQIVLRVAAGMLAPVFFTALIFRRTLDIWRAALAADLLMLLAGSGSLLHETFIVATPYGTSLTCAGLALLALRRADSLPSGWQRSALFVSAVAGLLIAQVVNYGFAMLALPLLGLLTVLLPSPARLRLFVLICATGFLTAVLPAAIAPHYPTSLALSPSFGAMARFLREVTACASWSFLPAFVIPVGLVWIAHRYGDRPRPLTAFRALAIASAGSAVVLFVLAAWSEHVMLNSYSPRYFVPGFVMLLALAGAGLWQTLRQMLPTRLVRDALFVMLSLLMLVTARGRLEAMGEPTQDIIGWGKAPLARTVAQRALALSLDGLVGSYWDVWPAVFATEQMHHDAHWTGPDILGITKRGEPRRDVFLARLMARGRLRVACIAVTLSACLDITKDVMRTPELRIQALATSDAIGDGQFLFYAEILPLR